MKQSGVEGCTDTDALWLGPWIIQDKKKAGGRKTPEGVQSKGPESKEEPGKALKIRALKLWTRGNSLRGNSLNQDFLAGCTQTVLEEVLRNKHILLLYTSNGMAEHIKKMFVSGTGKNQEVFYTSEKRPVLSYGKLFSFREVSGHSLRVTRPGELSRLVGEPECAGKGFRLIIDNVARPGKMVPFFSAGVWSSVLAAYDLGTLDSKRLEELAAWADTLLLDLSNISFQLAKPTMDLKVKNCAIERVFAVEKFNRTRQEGQVGRSVKEKEKALPGELFYPLREAEVSGMEVRG
ncbi:TPA: hypothetical protein HA351_01300 [Methanosarcinaceae archaeon]|nr:hypothetical protein [Methanosarcinaceae archaeon]